MKYTIEPSSDSQYIVVTPIGELRRDVAVEVTTAMYAKGTELGIDCYLLDVTNARNMDRPMVNVQFTIDDLPATPHLDPDRLCVAVLVDPKDHSHDFYVAFATSQGIDTTLFWNREAAIEHLEKAAARLRIADSHDPAL